MNLWLIGMSGAGKSTIAHEVRRRLVSDGRQTPVVLLDGDELRAAWGNATGHSVSQRYENGQRLSRLAKLLGGQGVDLIVAALSIFPDLQAWNRQNIRGYHEVYLQVPFDKLVERDTKGLYAEALDGKRTNVVGVDIEFPEPPSPDLIVNTSTQSPQDSASAVLHSLCARNRW